MNRLLHAAARGARIEVKCDKWEEDRCVMVWDLQHEQLEYRIHPDDEALQYGPISSALRQFAETGKEPYTVSGLMAMHAFRYECPYPFIMSSEWPHAQMFALILSEALADEGL